MSEDIRERDVATLRGHLLTAIRGAWTTRPTCWDRQVEAVVTVLSEQVIDRWGLAELIGSSLEAAQVRDPDGVTALVLDVISPVLVEYGKRVRAKVAEEILADVAALFAARIGADIWEAAYRAAYVARGES